MTPAKDIVASFMSSSRKLLSLDGIKKKLCLVMPNFEALQTNNMDSADILLSRIKARSPDQNNNMKLIEGTNN